MIRCLAEDPRYGKFVGEIPIDSLSFGQARGQVGTASVTTSTDTLVFPGETVLHVVEGAGGVQTGLWSGLILGRDSVPGSGTQRLSASGWKWVLGHRFLRNPIAASASELQVALAALNTSNTAPSFEVVIQDTVPSGPTAQIEVAAGRSVLSVVDEMANGFDWAVYPTFNASSAVPSKVIDITPLTGFGTPLGLTHGGNCSITSFAESAANRVSTVVAASTGSADELVLAEAYVDAAIRVDAWVTPSGVVESAELEGFATDEVLRRQYNEERYTVEVDLLQVPLVRLRQGGRVWLTGELGSKSLDREPMRITGWSASITSSAKKGVIQLVPVSEYT